MYYNCVKFHNNSISSLVGVVLTRYMDGWTDGQGDSYIPPSNFVCGGYKKEFPHNISHSTCNLICFFYPVWVVRISSVVFFLNISKTITNSKLDTLNFHNCHKKTSHSRYISAKFSSKWLSKWLQKRFFPFPQINYLLAVIDIHNLLVHHTNSD